MLFMTSTKSATVKYYGFSIDNGKVHNEEDL